MEVDTDSLAMKQRNIHKAREISSFKSGIENSQMKTGSLIYISRMRERGGL